MTFTHALATNNYGPAKFIVSANAYEGTHTTIASALTSASSGDTIFIRPGTYTENPTLKAGVNLVAFTGDGETPNVTIVGNPTFTGTGTVSIGNIRLQTNSAALLTVSGSNASIVNLVNCYLNASNNAGITLSSSNASSAIFCKGGKGDIGTTGIAFFAHSGAGPLQFEDFIVPNTGASVTPATVSGSGSVQFLNCYINFAVTTSSTSSFLFAQSQQSVANTTNSTIGGTGANLAVNSTFNSGTASAISIGTGATLAVTNSLVVSSNTNAITGAGTLAYSGIVYGGSSNGVNTTTLTRYVIDGGEYKGRTINTAPSAGMIGEQIQSVVGAGSPVSVSTTTATNVTSISLTAGIWDVSALGAYSSTAITGTEFEFSINTTSATRGSFGDNNAATPYPPNAASPVMITVPAYRITLSATTTVYLVAYGVYTVGALTSYGRLSAKRVA